MTDLLPLVLGLMKQPTARDLQTTIGPSSLGTSCDFCLAQELSSPAESDLFHKPYWLGAWEGTAIHAYLESLAETHDWQGERYHTEKRVVVGQVGTYGVVSGSTDLYLPDRATVVDWKTSTRAKVKLLRTAFAEKYTPYDPEPLLQARFTAKKYIGQFMLYGKGWEDAGNKVDTVAAVFINRDGTGDSDIWVHEMPYNRAYAEKVLDRANRIWVALEGGKPVSSFLSRIACYSCSTSGEPRKYSKTPF